MKERRRITWMRVAPWCLAALALACENEMKPPENRAPVTVGSIPPVTVNEGEEFRASVAQFFNDPDGDTLTFAAKSSDETVVTATMSEDTMITVNAVAEGAATITVTATDPDGESAMQTAMFTVLRVNRAPTVKRVIGDGQLDVGASDTLLLSDYFSDPDGDSLAYEAESENEEVVETELDGAELLIRGVGAGTATITVTAADPDGASISQMAEFTIRPGNRAPVVTDSIEAEEWEVDTAFFLTLSNHFSDPDGDELTYEATSDDEEVVGLDLFEEELEMYGVGVGVTTITITATDLDGLSATMSFTATIVEE